MGFIRLKPQETKLMAKRTGINQSAEIRTLLGAMGKDTKFKEMFRELQAKHKGHKFNENSCQQAFALARRHLGFTKGKKSKRVLKPKTAMEHAVHGGRGANGRDLRHGEGIVQAIRSARSLLAACGNADAAKRLIDELSGATPF
jgi:hypothetical protein